MSDPIRWRAPGGDAPAGVRDLLQHANAPTVMDAATRAKHAAMVAKVTAGAAGAAAGAGAAKMTLGAKLLAGIGLATAVAVGTVPAVRARMAQREATTAVARAHEAPVARATERAAEATGPTVVETPAAVEVVAPVVVVAPTVTEPAVAQPTTTAAGPTIAGATARRATTHAAGLPGHSLSGGATPVGGGAAPAPSLAPVAAPGPTPTADPVVAAAAPESPHVEALTQEQAILDPTVEARSNPREALDRADRHAREFPNGQMAADREFVAFRALIDLGRAAEARTRGEALIARFPDSPYIQQTRRLLNTLP